MLGIVLAALLSTHCGELCSPVARILYQDLLESGGYGRFDTELGAFLIRESDGTLTTQPWPDSGYRMVRYRGTIPRGAIAVMHTHPRNKPSPSAHDREEAKRIGMPVLVISADGVIGAFPDGALVRLTFAEN